MEQFEDASPYAVDPHRSLGHGYRTGHWAGAGRSAGGGSNRIGPPRQYVTKVDFSELSSEYDHHNHDQCAAMQRPFASTGDFGTEH